MKDGSDPARTLRRIADALGLPPEIFFGDDDRRTDVLADLAAMAELLRLWSALRSDVDRANLLAQIRDLVRQRDN
ncbi:hypothetical protein Q8W71_26075 [Methylobacterium sp. NEAU 140]|uniref:hypothetical protein n=1 Tax=Methylobacterium sp. NEAU 140 TaxID=3064945 RepID=UPI002733ADBD|nr:hypothetical protein [Methylobacterium sp. NEAU 140]MDP4026101.1 hypothetical protein [Methylobacterium sp. NEAU 140]